MSKVTRVFVNQSGSITIGPDIYTGGFIKNPPKELIRMAERKETIFDPKTGTRVRRVLLPEEVDEGSISRVASLEATRDLMSSPPLGDLPVEAKKQNSEPDQEELQVLDGEVVL